MRERKGKGALRGHCYCRVCFGFERCMVSGVFLKRLAMDG
jgi:hypothetical protein